MWVDKYRPTCFNELLSHDRTNRDLLRWLKAWDSCVFNTPARNKPRVFRKDAWAMEKAAVRFIHPLAPTQREAVRETHSGRHSEEDGEGGGARHTHTAVVLPQQSRSVCGESHRAGAGGAAGEVV
jgi:hypothetical protein